MKASEQLLLVARQQCKAVFSWCYISRMQLLVLYSLLQLVLYSLLQLVLYSLLQLGLVAREQCKESGTHRRGS